MRKVITFFLFALSGCGMYGGANIETAIFVCKERGGVKYMISDASVLCNDGMKLDFSKWSKP